MTTYAVTLQQTTRRTVTVEVESDNVADATASVIASADFTVPDVVLTQQVHRAKVTGPGFLHGTPES